MLEALQSYQGENFAPLAPLKNAKKTARDGGGSSMTAYFREVYDEIVQADAEAWREHLEMGRVISNLRSGKLIHKKDLSGNGYVFLPPVKTKTSDRSNYPVFPQISEDLKSKWLRVKPLVRGRHYGDGYKAEIQLNTVNRVIESYFKDIFDAEYELNECLSAQDFGGYVTRFYYDQRLNQIRKTAPILKNESKVLIDGFAACYRCDFEGKPEDFRKTGAAYPQCPECGSFKTTKMLEPTVVDEQRIVGAQEIVQGDITGCLLNFPAFKYDCRVLPHHSSYQLYKQFIPLRLAHALFGNLDIEGDSGMSNELGLQLMESLAARGGHMENLGENSIFGKPSVMGRRAVINEMWLTPEWYAGFKLERDEETISGRIPAGVPFEELFPEKICVVGFNDMRLQVGFYAEKSHIVGGVYFIQSFSGLGKGMSDGADIAKDLSEIHSMAMAGLKRYGASGLYYDKSIPESQIRNLFNPRKATAVDLQGKDDIRKFVGQVQFQPVNPVLPQYAVQLSNLLNLVNMSGDFSEGTLQSVDINTLGGQQLATAKEEGKKGAIISMKVNHRELSAEAIHELFVQHIKFPRYFASESDRHSATKGKWVSGMEMPQKVRFDAVPGSELPTNEFDKKQSAQLMIEKAGGLGNISAAIQADPRLASWYASLFNVDLPTMNQEEVWITCLSRLDSIKELSEMFADPRQVLSQLKKPVFLQEDAHLLKANFLSQVLDDDEISTWNPVAKAAVQQLIDTHRDLARQIQLQAEMREQNAQFHLEQRGMQFQQAMMQPQIDAQQQAQAQQAEQQLLLGAAEKVADDEQKQVDHDRQLEMKEADHARAMELEEMRGKQKLKNSK